MHLSLKYYTCDLFIYINEYKTQIFFTAFVIGYMIYDWGNKEYDRLQRKNPADYANDE